MPLTGHRTPKINGVLPKISYPGTVFKSPLTSSYDMFTGPDNDEVFYTCGTKDGITFKGKRGETFNLLLISRLWMIMMMRVIIMVMRIVMTMTVMMAMCMMMTMLMVMRVVV